MSLVRAYNRRHIKSNSRVSEKSNKNELFLPHTRHSKLVVAFIKETSRKFKLNHRNLHIKKLNRSISIFHFI